ncbi:uncharacterized protein LOC141604868 [Silene latifolia]|uniref:uncharacterized protein LOC141604868 n=1 Tax=Silene latifolia TaxID=37657 RepID=UPI003D7784C1
MERSEPSLVPEWLRSNGGGGSGHQFATSQADGPVLALPRRTRSSKNISNSDSLHSPLLDRSSSSNSRRSSNSNGFHKHDKNSYARPYSSYSRSHRDRDRERSVITDSWDSDYSDPLKGVFGGRAEDPLWRPQSSISRRQDEAPSRRIPADMRNGVHKNGSGNGSQSSGVSVTGIQKGSFEREFPMLGVDERPKTPDVIRVSSPGLSRGIQSMSIGNSLSVGGEGWTSALVEVPSAPGSNSSNGSAPAMQPGTATSVSSPSSMSDTSNPSSSRSLADLVGQTAAQGHNTSQPSAQFQSDEFALAQSKKLIPMTPSLPKTLVLSSSDKLKPKAAIRSSETIVTPKNGLSHLSSLQPGSQPARGVNVRGDGPTPKSPSSGKLLLLKPGRENGVSSGLKDLQSPPAIINNKVANGQSTGNPSLASGSTKNSHNPNPKILPGERKASGHGSNPGAGVDKRTSRSNFFKLMREKSLNNTSGPVDSGTSALSDVVDKSDKDANELACAQMTSAESRTELKCSGETCTVDDAVISPPSVVIDNEEERAFLLSLGWEDHAEDDDEEGLTEEEIRGFYVEVMKQCPTSRVCRVIQAKIFSHVGCSSSNEANSPASQTEA